MRFAYAGRNVTSEIDMHPFPPSEALQVFVGDEIAQIWLDPHSVQFRFESGRSLFCGYRLEHCEPDGSVWSYDCDPTVRQPLLLQQLLYRPVTRIDREDLRLTFHADSGATLTIFTEVGPYECGLIEGPELGQLVF